MIFTIYDTAGEEITRLEADRAVYGEGFTVLIKNNKEHVGMLYARIQHKSCIVKPFVKIFNEEGTGCVTHFIPEVGSIGVSVTPPKEKKHAPKKKYLFDSPKRCPYWSDKTGYPVCSYYPGKPALCSADEIPENCPLEDAAE